MSAIWYNRPLVVRSLKKQIRILDPCCLPQCLQFYVRMDRSGIGEQREEWKGLSMAIKI